MFQEQAHAGAVDVLTATLAGARVLISFQAVRVEKQRLHSGKRGTTTVLEADCGSATPRSYFVQLYIIVHFLGMRVRGTDWKSALYGVTKGFKTSPRSLAAVPFPLELRNT